ncbi:hypothetical protein JHD50_10930 [Sulfurimonas sp. MAG313]|nr:hypothetical protein [Sulfurimonas sp. MAG313]MDF1881806.1 hypothetical protein [Sulfurimonas sp. MAG313]
MIKLFVLLFPIILFSWEEYKSVDDIHIYKQDKSQFDFAQFKAETIISVSIDEITKHIINPKTYIYWLSDCINARQDNDNIYILMQPPWPLRKRQVMSKLNIKTYANKKEITLSSINKQPPSSNGIWFNYLYAMFTLEPINETHTKVTLSLVGDPGGFPPAWIVNLMAWEIPYKSLRDLKLYLKNKN